MGILMLTSLAKHGGLMKPQKLRDCNLVIDGGHYSSRCYRETGGHYDEYAKRVKQRLQDFAECNIRCHVVFHGEHDDLNMKENAATLAESITKAAAAVDNPPRWNSSFLNEIMMAVMDDMNVPYVTCDNRRTDETIVALAKHFNCAIMTDDSDLFISEAPCIHYESCLRQPKTNYLLCDIFKRAEFLEKYQLRKDMLPLLYMLLNTKTKGKEYFSTFLREQKIRTSLYFNTHHTPQISDVLRWLSRHTYTSALDAIMRHVPTEGRVKCQQLLEASVGLMSNTETTNFAIKILLDSVSVIIQNNDRDWFEKGIATRHVPAMYVDLYNRRLLTMYHRQVEFYDVEDPFRPCLRIVRYAFDLLTGFSGSRFHYVGRKGAQIDRLEVTGELSVSKPERCSAIPFGSGWDELPDYFGHFLRETLPGLSSDALAALPADCRLFMVALVWWKTYAARQAVAEVQSLLFCYLRGSVLSTRKEERGEAAKAKKSQHRRKLFTEADSAKASAVFMKFKDDQARPEYDKSLLQAFAQFQHVLKHINCLSQLCGAAYEPTRYHEVYCGRFAYHSCLVMREHAEPEAFVAKCMRETGSVYEFYKRMKAVYEQCVETGERRGEVARGRAPL